MTFLLLMVMMAVTIIVLMAYFLDDGRLGCVGLQPRPLDCRILQGFSGRSGG
jgi:hypothetical protein